MRVIDISSGEERSNQVSSLIYRFPKATFSWHSVSCVCDSCLFTDAALAYFGGIPNDRIDLEGLMQCSPVTALSPRS